MTISLSPEQKAAMERWWKKTLPDKPIDWNWLLTPDEELAAFLRMTPDELAKFCVADSEEVAAKREP